MILGIDLGNYAVKVSNGNTFPSKCSRTPNLLKNTSIAIDNETYYIGEGTYDTEYHKVQKQSLLPLFYYALPPEPCKVVVGLPISQYKQDKDKLRELLMQRRYVAVNGVQKRTAVVDVAVYPEGLAAIYGSDFEGVLIDIGGRTTDCVEIISSKARNPFSLPHGTLNLYSDFIKALNTKGYDLQPEDAEKILRKGLRYNGEPVDMSEAMQVFREYVETLVNNLQIEYSIRTRDVLCIGGGSELLYRSLKNRIPGAALMHESVFANAVGLAKVGRYLWA
jgi:plasmid segregation protein ParM